MNWEKPILTDSGGFQIMSLSKLNKIDKDILKSTVESIGDKKTYKVENIKISL